MKLLYRALNDLWYQYGSWLHFSLDYIGLLQLLLNYRNKLVYFWWKATVPLNFQIWALFVDDWMDGSWWRCRQWEREKTPTRWWDWSSWPLKKALPILSNKDFFPRICARAPVYACGATKGLSDGGSSLGFVFTASRMVTCTSIAGNGLWNLTPWLRELHCGVFFTYLDKLTCNRSIL